jgi:putative DNA primase/helicase
VPEAVAESNKKIAVAPSTIDFAQLAAELLARAETLVPDWLPGGRRDVAEWRCGSLDGEAGDSCAVNLRTGVWADFNPSGAGQGGDLISLYAAIHGLKQGEAARELSEKLNVGAASSPRRVGAAPTSAAPAPDRRRSDWRSVVPVPDIAQDPPGAHPHRGAPETTWRYMRDGAFLGLVCRFGTSDGGKEVLPLTWCVNEHDGRGGMKWHWKAWDAPRPLYLPSGTLRPGTMKVVVEGEKCALALHEQIGDQFDAVSWPGGGKSVSLGDWSWVAGEKVILWGDVDSHRRRLTEAEKLANVDPATVDYLPTEKQPGAATMLKLAEKLVLLGCEVWLVPFTAAGELPDGWDCADAIAGIGVEHSWGPEDLRSYLRRAKRWEAPATVKNEAAKVTQRAADNGARRSATAGEGSGGGPDDVLFGWPHYGKEGPKATRENALHAMRLDMSLKGLVGLNEFSHQVFKLRPTPWPSPEGVWTEVDDFKLAEYLVTRHDLSGSLSHDAITQALRVIAHEHRFHPVRERLLGLEWDRTDRLDHWLYEALGLNSDAMSVRQAQYLAHVGRWFLMGMVRRVMQPGCKWDYMLVLEGPQGYGKSTLGKVLAGDYFSDTHLNLGDKDSYLQLQGRLLHEFSELHSLSGKDVTLVKAFLTSTTDYLRAPFDRRPAEYPRQCVFFGTSNNAKWARDRSGNRRFWPVEVVQPINIDWVSEHLDQLFAEAVARVQAGERSYPTHEEERQWFAPEQSKRVQSTATEEALFQFLCGERDSRGANKELAPPSEVSLIKCLEGIGIDVAKSASNRMVQGEVIELLHKWGWRHERSSRKIGTKRPYVYVAPASWPPREELTPDDEVPVSLQAQAGSNGDDDDVPF